MQNDIEKDRALDLSALRAFAPSQFVAEQNAWIESVVQTRVNEAMKLFSESLAKWADQEINRRVTEEVESRVAEAIERKISEHKAKVQARVESSKHVN